MSDKVPPYSEDDEKGLLGCLILAPEDSLQVAGINRKWFYVERHQVIFDAIATMVRSGEAVTVVTLNSFLSSTKAGRKAGDITYLNQLTECTPSATNVLYYAKILEALAIRRLYHDLSFAMESEESSDPEVLVTNVEALIAGIRQQIKPNQGRPTARPLSELARSPRNDPAELLRHRFLCRLGTLMICGPTGIGKSSLSLQFAIRWSLGHECFGIAPARALKFLIIQAENDDADLAEMRDGVFNGLRLPAADYDRACENVLVVREDERAGPRFFAETLRPLLAKHRPDIVIIDPVLSFLGGDASSQKDVGPFLRNNLNPALREFNCAAIIIHHTNKPASGKEKPEWRGGDFAYLGSGSAEFANHARAVIALRSIGSREGFELNAGKRGSRLGWRGPDGETAYTKYLAHATEPGVICWREVAENEIDTGGRPRNGAACLDDVLEVLPGGGLTSSEWAAAAKQEYGVSERSFYRDKKALEKTGRVLKSEINGKWQPIRKS